MRLEVALLSIPFALPNGFTRTDSERLCFVILCKDDSVSVFLTAANGNRVRFQIGVHHALDRGIEVIHINMEDCAV